VAQLNSLTQPRKPIQLADLRAITDTMPESTAEISCGKCAMRPATDWLSGYLVAGPRSDPRGGNRKGPGLVEPTRPDRPHDQRLGRHRIRLRVISKNPWSDHTPFLTMIGPRAKAPPSPIALIRRPSWTVRNPRATLASSTHEEDQGVRACKGLAALVNQYATPRDAS
jgi:hypothetical protein